MQSYLFAVECEIAEWMRLFLPLPRDKKLSCFAEAPLPPPSTEEGHGHPRLQNELSDTVLVHSQGK